MATVEQRILEGNSEQAPALNGHDSARVPALNEHGSTVCGKISVLKGHDFSRAVGHPESTRALAPEGILAANSEHSPASDPQLPIEQRLEAELAKDLLRFSTAGSVDDGKSTLIGRLLYDSHNVYDDHIRSVTRNAAIDFAQLTDGLRAEREQGITIDVAYRYFSTPKTKIHHRRHSRPRAVHAQHGHRRLHR